MDKQYPPCDFCGVVPEHHPWHGSGMFKGIDSPHIHACNDCRHLLPSHTAQGEPDQARLRERFAEIEREIAENKHTASSVFTQMRTAAFYTTPRSAVQGEPVAYLRKDQLVHVRRMGPMLGEIADSSRADRVPVYAAPQPAERGEPVAAQHRFRHPQKPPQDWSIWQPATVSFDRPSWGIDSQGYEVEYRLLYDAPQPAEQQPELAKYQPCGCVICACEHETQCQGCGGHHCGTHPVGQLPTPAYLQAAEQQPATDVAQLVEALECAHRFITNGVALGYIQMPDADTQDAAHKTLPAIEAALTAHRKGD